MFKYFKNDIKAGLVVFLVALPLCLGIALSQGVPLFSGIISGVVGGFVVAAISKSGLSVSGPAAGLTAIVLTSIQALGGFEIFLLALCIAGVMQIILGLVKAGIIGYYIPSSVIKGMLAAIGIILIIKQIPHFVGYDSDPEGDESFFQKDGENSFSELLHMSQFISYGSLIIAFVSLALLIVWQMKSVKQNKVLGLIPAPLIVVAVGILIDLCFNTYLPSFSVKDEHLVNLPDMSSFSDLRNSFFHPDLSAWSNPKVYEVAFILAAVASLETLLNVEAIDKLDPENKITPTNRELIAQGFGNLVCGMIGGIPVTSVIVRSAANVSAGGKTKLSAMFHALLFIVTIILIPGILELIPLSALAAILIFTGFKLTSPKVYKNIYKLGWDQFIPFALTIIVMLLSDLLKGVSCGIFAGIIFILRNNYRSPFKMVKDEIEGRIHYFIKLSQNVTFLNKGKIIEVLHSIPKGAKVYIDGGRASFVDKDILEIISDYKRSSHFNNIEVITEEIQEVDTFN
ncbi:MAG: SulP family inorganic anion transporter [Bacteroidia bacterium]